MNMKVVHVMNGGDRGNLFESFLHSQLLLHDECIIVSSRLAFVSHYRVVTNALYDCIMLLL